MLQYGPEEPDALTLLTKYTIYPDIKAYWVPQECFVNPPKNYLLKSDFKRYPMRTELLATRVTHALEFERFAALIDRVRILQHVYVRTEDVLAQIE